MIAFIDKLYTPGEIQKVWLYLHDLSANSKS